MSDSDSDSVAARILRDFDADSETIRDAVTTLLSADPPAPRPDRGTNGRVDLAPDSSIEVGPTGSVRQL